MALMPSTQLVRKESMLSAISLTDCSTLYAMTGIKTFSSKLPCDAAIPTAASLPMTCTATMVTCSHWVGLTFPGMIELPGSFSGMSISFSPPLGPLESHLTSLAIFIISAASALTAPCRKTSASFEVSAWNLFSSLTNFSPVSSVTAAAAASANPRGALRPVPTAVPPRASSLTGSSASRI